jgi:hypothetical protein
VCYFLTSLMRSHPRGEWMCFRSYSPRANDVLEIEGTIALVSRIEWSTNCSRKWMALRVWKVSTYWLLQGTVPSLFCRDGYAHSFNTVARSIVAQISSTRLSSGQVDSTSHCSAICRTGWNVKRHVKHILDPIENLYITESDLGSRCAESHRLPICRFHGGCKDDRGIFRSGFASPFV